MAPRKVNLKDRILDKALELGEASSWEAVRLHDIADQLEITLDEIRQHFPQKDDLVEAWFDRADQAVLGERVAAEDYLARPDRERLQRVIMLWLDALASHRRLTREMLAYKLEFGHIHLQVLGLMRISRTVQWFREAACVDATGIQRILEESTLTAIYLMTFARWLFDDTPASR
jgi:AcrR family transcriptional regulator